jgi:hypothetical protein
MPRPSKVGWPSAKGRDSRCHGWAPFPAVPGWNLTRARSTPAGAASTCTPPWPCPPGTGNGLERLCRYIARPPLAHDRLERLPDGRVALRLKRPFSDGSTHVIFTPEALIERLCALVPRPRTHRVRYHGLLAPASPFRRLVVPEAHGRAPRPTAGRPGADEPGKAFPHQVSDRTRFRWILWAALLRRVFDVDALACPKCSGRMRVVSAIVKAEVVAKILQSLGLSAEPREIRRARSPPEPGFVEYDLY